jgi:hypothetical protein
LDRAIFGDTELVNDGVVVGLARLQFGRWEIRMVRRIGKMLRFHAEGVADLINLAALAGDRAVQEIAGVELQAGLGRPDFHDAAAGRFDDARGQRRIRPGGLLMTQLWS